MGWSDDSKLIVPRVVAQEFGHSLDQPCNGDETKISKILSCAANVITSTTTFSDFVDPNHASSPDTQNKTKIAIANCIQTNCRQNIPLPPFPNPPGGKCYTGDVAINDPVTGDTTCVAMCTGGTGCRSSTCGSIPANQNYCSDKTYTAQCDPKTNSFICAK